ncbi:hypothetical protein RHGRI_022255 [Rhododendron griersonianum]|uniref:Uncharacterized protein n=1 Tax=Rhododendron griersonianum TaxID=479676 RepID=A0AAV6J3B9_9ERIC|nr:hypothetical protein RHGRI_022255 [Rhododendron griersonianum]
MLDLQKTLPMKNHLPSLTPVYQSNGNSVSTWTGFDFWGDQRSHVYDNYNSDDYGACSPRFCTSPLLPRNHQYSYPLSPKSRLQAIVDGRKELMEIIQDMPESSYELSFKDIVDEQQEADQKDIEIDEGSLKYKPDINMKQKKKKKKIMSRSESMDSGVFLLKMPFPTSLGMKGKSTAGNHRSKVSLKPPLEGSDNTGDKEWWRVRFLSTGEGKKRGKSSIRGSISSSSSGGSSRSREDDSDFTPGCWSFGKKCRSRQQRGAACE